MSKSPDEIARKIICDFCEIEESSTDKEIDDSFYCANELIAAIAQAIQAERNAARGLVEAVEAHLNNKHSHYLIPYALQQKFEEYKAATGGDV